jgi:hypothetical protein
MIREGCSIHDHREADVYMIGEKVHYNYQRVGNLYMIRGK